MRVSSKVLIKAMIGNVKNVLFPQHIKQYMLLDEGVNFIVYLQIVKIN